MTEELRNGTVVTEEKLRNGTVVTEEEIKKRNGRDSCELKGN